MNYNFNNYNQPNFGAIKIIKCSDQEYFKIMEKYGENLAKNSYILFKNRSINDCNTFSHIKELIKKKGYSPDWLAHNCNYNGIELPNVDVQPLFEFSDTDIIKLALFQVKSIFRGILFGVKKSENFQETPEHLKSIKALNDFANYNYQRFLKFITKNNAQEVSLDEYLKELAQKFGK